MGRRTRWKQNLTTATLSDVAYLEKKSMNASATHEKIFLEELPSNMLKHEISETAAIYSSFNQAAQKNNK